MDLKKSEKLENKKMLVKLIISFLIFLIIYLMPRQEGLTKEGQESLAIFIFALFMWVLRPIPIHLTSIICILLLPILKIVENQSVVFQGLGADITWLLIASFVLTSAMNKSKLGRRIALFLLVKLGKSPSQTLGVLVVINYILAIFIPSAMARASLLLPISLMILDVYELKPGEGNFGKLMMLQGLQSNAFATSAFLTATAGQMVALEFINRQAEVKLGYIDWLVGGVSQAVLTGIITFFIGLKIFNIKNEGGKFNREGRKKLEEDYKKIGKMSRDEKKVSIILLLTLFLWVTNDYHNKWFGFTISVEQAALISMLACLLPVIGVLKWEEAEISWDLMIFSAGAYAVGNAFNDTGGASWIINKLVYALGLENMNHNILALVLIFISIYTHMIFTSKIVRATILIPVIIELANSVGMNPVPIALACSYGISYAITLPPHVKANTMYFSTGYFTIGEEFLFGILSCFIGGLSISLIYFGLLKNIY